MLSFLSNTRVYLAVGATALRKSFDTLAGVVRNYLRLDPLSGHLFVFTNAWKNRLKILFWDKTGWWVCAKRLEVGTPPWPAFLASSGFQFGYGFERSLQHWLNAAPEDFRKGGDFQNSGPLPLSPSWPP